MKLQPCILLCVRTGSADHESEQPSYEAGAAVTNIHCHVRGVQMGELVSVCEHATH
jgi:hypothetical protein